MDVRTALVALRSELHLRQTDFAVGIGVSEMTVNRWETGKNPPSRALSLSILAYASAHGASKVCLSALNEALLGQGSKLAVNDLKNVALAQINQLANDSPNGVFVCDARTHELLYANSQMCRFTHQTAEQAAKKRCYEYLFNRKSPCSDCPIPQESADYYTSWEYRSPVTGRIYIVRGKLLSWGGQKAHLEYVTDITDYKAVRREDDPPDRQDP